MHVPDEADSDRRPGGQPTPGLDSGPIPPRAVILNYSIYSGQYFTVLLSNKQNSKSNGMF